jgi:hypothetical protein
MSTTDLSRKADAVMSLARGLSRKEVAEQAGVAPSTVSAWLRNPAYAAEVAALKAVIEVKPLAPAKVLEALQACHDRIRGPVPGTVTVSIPAGASARKRRQLLARGIARALSDRGQL